MASQYNLISAIKDGEVDKVGEILQTTGLGHQPDLKGHLLLIAIEEDQAEVVDLLCRDGRWKNVVRSDDLSPIHVACKYGNVRIIETLLRNGSAVNEQSPEHRFTPLLMAVRWRHQDAVRHLLDSGADANISSAHYKQVTTPLHEAVATLNEDIVNYLLARNADVNQLNGLRQLPLHVLCGSTKESRDPGCCRSRIAKRLIACGSNVTADDSTGNTPLHHAVSSHVQNGNTALIQMLCVSGAFINAYNIDGDTPLHRVAAYKCIGARLSENIEIIKQLIQFGANVNKEAMDGRIPLQDALNGQFVSKIADILVEAGSNIDHTDSQGLTIFHKTALNWGNLESVKYLIRKGVVYDTISHKRTSPLTAACVSGHIPTIHLICSECPSLLAPRPEMTDCNFRPLTTVVKLLNFQMVVFLLNAGYRYERHELEYNLESPVLDVKIAHLFREMLDKGQPHTLKQTCRDNIRFCMNGEIWQKVSVLPLPESLKKYLLLGDLRPPDVNAFDYSEF